MGLSLRESEKDESVDIGKTTIFVLLEHQLFDGDIFDDLLFLGVLESQLFEVETLFNGLNSLLSTFSFGGIDLGGELGGSFDLLLLLLMLFFVLLEAGLVPLIFGSTVFLRRRRVLDAERDFKELHDPGQELPRRDGLAFLYVCKLIFADADHARTLVGDVVGELGSHRKDFAKLLLYDFLEVNDSPAVKIFEDGSLSLDSDTSWTSQQNTEVGRHFRGLFDVETRLFHELLEVIFGLEDKHIVTEMSGEFGQTCLDLATLELNWVDSLPETPLTGKEESFFVQTGSKELFKAASTILDDVSNGSKRLSGVWLHSNENTVSKLLWGQAGDVNLDVGAVEKLDDELVKDVSLVHVVVLDLEVEVLVTITASRDHLSLVKRAFNASCNELF